MNIDIMDPTIAQRRQYSLKVLAEIAHMPPLWLAAKRAESQDCG
jgi:hypothetical protein